MSNRKSKVGAAKAPLADLSEFDDCGLEADTDKTIVVEEGKHTAPALMLTSKGRICDMPTEPVSDKKSCSQQDETEVKKPVEHKAETERVRKKKPHVHKHNGAADMRGANYGTAAVVIGHVEGNVTTNIYHDGKHVHSNAGSRIHGEAEQRVLASQKQLTKYDLRKVTIGRRWRELAHELGFSDDELYFIREDFIREGMHEVVYQFLASWQERKSSEATLGVLAQAYAKIGKVSYVLELSKLFPG